MRRGASPLAGGAEDEDAPHHAPQDPDAGRGGKQLQDAKKPRPTMCGLVGGHHGADSRQEVENEAHDAPRAPAHRRDDNHAAGDGLVAVEPYARGVGGVVVGVVVVVVVVV
jgi:hypothetical protein